MNAKFLKCYFIISILILLSGILLIMHDTFVIRPEFEAPPTVNGYELENAGILYLGTELLLISLVLLAIYGVIRIAIKVKGISIDDDTRSHYLKVYNYRKWVRTGGGPIIFTSLAIMFYLFFIDVFLQIELVGGDTYILAFIMFFPVVLLGSRNWFAPFILDEKGIRNKWLGRNIFIPWEEFNYIGVGESVLYKDYRFLLYFSKIPLKDKQIYRVDHLMRQNKKHFFIMYREGMLKEILKYVEREKIKHIERIESSPNPHQKQSYLTSWKLIENRPVD